MWDEMDDTNRTLNQKGLMAYEAADATSGTKVVPGMENDQNMGKLDFRRYGK